MVPRTRWLLAVLLPTVLILQGCGPGVQESFQLISYADQIGSRTPYCRSQFFAAEVSLVWAALCAVLDRNGAQILIVDVNDGVLTWCDTAVGFVALPTHMRKHRAVGLAPSTAFTQGYVYGTARLRSTDTGTWVYLSSRAREFGVERTVFSDGSYEYRLFNTLDRSLRDKPHPVAAVFQPSPAPSRDPPTTYEQLFSSHFHSLPPLPGAEIRATGLSKVYPLPPAEVWAACLDILSQADILAHVSPPDRTAVLLQGTSIAGDKRDLRYFDSLLAIYLQPLANTGTNVFAAFLAPDGLRLEAIPDITQLTPQQRKQLTADQPRKLAAAVLAQEFFDHLSTQLLHTERWAHKFAPQPPNTSTP